MFFDDAAEYNPCDTKSNVFFYPHQSDIDKYYQCDESGNAYLRSCGNLVWDPFLVACNWPSAVKSAPPQAIETSSSSSWISTTTTTTVLPPTTTQWFSSTVSPPSFSLCKPINPCGTHGQCVESPATVPISSRRFACICSEDWLGKICDKRTDELTTPSSPQFDQNEEIASPTDDPFWVPVETQKYRKMTYYGSNDDIKAEQLHLLQARTIDIDSDEESELSPAIGKSNPVNKKNPVPLNKHAH